MRMIPPAVALVASLAGCTTLAPQAERVAVTRESADVANCTAMGEVRSYPPYGLPDDWKKQLKNAAAAKNADTVLVTQNPYLSLVSIPGIAYSCRAKTGA